MKKFKTLLVLMITVCFVPNLVANELNVYSARNVDFSKQIVDAYSLETGVKVNLIIGKKDELITQVKDDKNADILLLADSWELWEASDEFLYLGIKGDQNLLQTRSNLDPQYKASTNWIPTSMRLRTIVYSSERVKTDELKDYTSLADAKWQRKLCLRTSQKSYNKSLVAALVEQYGKDQATNIVKGWVKNLATDVFANDNAVIKAIAAGKCDVGIVNSYYYAKLMAAEKLPVNILLFDGVFSNVSGVGIIKSTKNLDGSTQFVSWLTSAKGQKIIADENFEFPINPQANIRKELTEWGEFTSNPIMLKAAKNPTAEIAQFIIQETNWQ